MKLMAQVGSNRGSMKALQKSGLLRFMTTFKMIQLQDISLCTHAWALTA